MADRVTRSDSICTVRQARTWGRQQLIGGSSPGVDARLLLEHSLGVDHATLISHDEELLSPAQWAGFQESIARARQGEPIPYIMGSAPFFGREFAVNPAVLIPRPETEELVQMAVEWAHRRGEVHIVDVGTGSGCIIVTLACALTSVKLSAIDLSEAALTVARDNAARHSVMERIRFYQGSLLAPLDAPADLIVANLPYISDDEWTALDDGVKSYEPASALRGGPDGLRLIRELLQQAVAGQLRSQGAVLLEIGWQQGQATCRLAKQIFPRADISLFKDVAGQDRLVKIQV